MSEEAVAHYALQLQEHLDVRVSVVQFHTPNDNLGMWPRTEPSSLVTVIPYAAGGARRLLLNSLSDLIKRLAAAAAPASPPLLRDAALEIGYTLLATGSWPSEELDCIGVLQWSMAMGLNCGPHDHFVSPVRYALTCPCRVER